jgi:CHAD domain-containing protein
VAARLKPDEAGARGVRRIARHRIKSALKTLQPGKSDDRAVHEARKDLKRARATLRLLRDALGPSTYKRENAAIRDAARPLSEVRDGRVLLDALGSLVKYYGKSAEALPLVGFKRVLNRRRTQLRKKLLDQPGPLRAVRRELREAHSRSEKWHVDGGGWSVVGTGLKRTYSKARKAFRLAHNSATDEHLHEWRKQTKYFWHQLQILEPLWPGPLGELADQCHKLADFLGDDHDLAVLREHALQAREAFPTEASHRALLGLIERCRAGLQEKALALGQRLYEEKPAIFAARLGKYWRDWHHS